MERSKKEINPKTCGLSKKLNILKKQDKFCTGSSSVSEDILWIVGYRFSTSPPKIEYPFHLP